MSGMSHDFGGYALDGGQSHSISCLGDPSTRPVRLVLADMNRAVCDAMARAFAGREGVRVVHGDLTRVPASAVIAAGNSFGLMDGGVDLALARRFPGVEAAVQAVIARHHGGLLPVGAAVVARTGDPETPWLIYAPTMMAPADIRGTANAYLAMHAAMTAAAGLGVGDVACPGLGTLTGRLPPDVAAQQMALAHRHATEGAPAADWQAAGGRYREIVASCRLPAAAALGRTA